MAITEDNYFIFMVVFENKGVHGDTELLVYDVTKNSIIFRKTLAENRAAIHSHITIEGNTVLVSTATSIYKNTQAVYSIYRFLISK